MKIGHLLECSIRKLVNIVRVRTPKLFILTWALIRFFTLGNSLKFSYLKINFEYINHTWICYLVKKENSNIIYEAKFSIDNYPQFQFLFKMSHCHYFFTGSYWNFCGINFQFTGIHMSYDVKYCTFYFMLSKSHMKYKSSIQWTQMISFEIEKNVYGPYRLNYGRVGDHICLSNKCKYKLSLPHENKLFKIVSV